MEQGAPVSKSERKRRVEALQALGAELVALADSELSAIELPEGLRAAVIEARAIRSFEARRRQLQYIGRLMRAVDPEPIRAALAERRRKAQALAAREQAAESWRERLLADEAALEELRREHPAAELPRLRALVRAARRERAAGLAPRAFRQLYRALRALLETSVASEAGGDDEVRR